MNAATSGNDKFYDDAVDMGLANGGKDSKAIYAAIKKARDANKDYKKTFFPQNIKVGGGTVKDDGGAFVQKVINGDFSGTQVSNWLYGSNNLKGVFSDKSLGAVNKLNTIFPKGSKGNKLIRDGAFLRVMEKSFKEYGSREFFSPEAFVKNINEMVSGNGRAVTAKLFSPAEMKELVSFAKQIEKLIPPKVFAGKGGGVEEFTEIWKSATRAGVGIGGFNLAGIQGTLFSRFVFDSATKQAGRNAELKLMKEIFIYFFLCLLIFTNPLKAQDFDLTLSIKDYETGESLSGLTVLINSSNAATANPFSMPLSLFFNVSQYFLELPDINPTIF